MKTHPIVLISGAPGAGKSTIARRLVETSPAPRAVHLVGDEFMRFIRKGFIAPHLPDSHQQNGVLMRSVVGAALPFAREGYEVLIDFVVGPWFVSAFREAVGDAPLDYVVLRASEQVCAQRAGARADHPILDYAPMRSLHASLSNLGAFERHAVDDMGEGVDALALRVRAGLERGDFRLS
jgi:predicted kinase